MSAGFMLSRRYRLIFVTSSHKSKPNISFSIIFRPFIITHTVPWLPHGFESLWRILPSTGRNFPFVQVQSASEILAANAALSAIARGWIKKYFLNLFFLIAITTAHTYLHHLIWEEEHTSCIDTRLRDSLHLICNLLSPWNQLTAAAIHDNLVYHPTAQ